MAQTTLNFGIEIELLLGPRKKFSSHHSSWKSLAKDLSKRLLKAGIPNHINNSNDKSPHNYRQWSITQEITIPNQSAKGLFGIELVSPVFSSSHSQTFTSQFSTIFSTIHSSYSIHPSPNCSTHIHISSASPLDLSLSSLAKTSLYFEPALDTLVPPSRGRESGTYWCQSNRSNPSLSGLALSQCLAVIGYAATSASASASTSTNNSPEAGGVIQAMNLFPCNSAYGKAHGYSQDFIRGKVYKWDLTGMIPGQGNGAIEFRQPPGSLTAYDAIGWAKLAMAFVAGGMVVGQRLDSGMEGLSEEGASVDDLWELLVGGAGVLGWEDGLGKEVEGLIARAG
ncbi:hypothetical protein QBC44DRAFT_383601 [Cladorrhinum sp. PSN332]|nr:hypothetical protein QBC44DRAFT_383601 [Cladorrhinum sp. PSN332]